MTQLRSPAIGFLVALVFTIFCWPGLHSDVRGQSCKPLQVILILRHGERIVLSNCGNWTGIVKDQIGAENTARPEQEIDSIPRAQVRFPCPTDNCPNSFPVAPAKWDTVTWTDGTRTQGTVEIACADNVCKVLQNGQEVRTKGSPTENAGWDLVRFIELVEDGERGL